MVIDENLMKRKTSISWSLFCELGGEGARGDDASELVTDERQQAAFVAGDEVIRVARPLAAITSFETALTWPETRQRIQALLKRGLQRDGDFEAGWPEVLGTLLETWSPCGDAQPRRANRAVPGRDIASRTRC